ncbi:MAG: tryptophan synthase subunit alpha [Kiritimatiellae bacterium]|nr:tryptophan synthase subunit alpha [Kiritimatiellia bacterium]
MQRITEAFKKAKRENRGAFVAYVTMGYPTLEQSERAVDDIIAAGADIIELGVPFSDPFADGGVIRTASYKALEQGVTINDVIASAARLRERHPDTAFVLFSYYNLIYSMGLENFAREAARAQIDAVLPVDLPYEERDELLSVIAPRGISFVPLIAPNTTLERVKAFEKGLDNTFLYVITVKGTTGERKNLPPDLAARLEGIRSLTHLPIAAGFGISTREQALEVCKHADGFVVGSRIVKCLSEGRKPCLS